MSKGQIRSQERLEYESVSQATYIAQKQAADDCTDKDTAKQRDQAHEEAEIAERNRSRP